MASSGRRRRRLAALATVLGALAAACAGGGPEAPAPATRTPSIETVAPAPAVATSPAATVPAVPPPATGTAAVPVPAPSATPAAPTTSPPGPATTDVAALPLEVQVGQLFSVAVYGSDASAPSAQARAQNLARFGVETAAEVVARYHLGGVTYFTHDGPATTNIATPAEVVALSQELQEAAVAASGIGLLIATDQEGGLVQRVRNPAIEMPEAAAFGALGDPALARRAAVVMGTELAALGIRWDFAPVADVDANPDNPVIGDRAFSPDPQVAAAMVAAQVEGFSAVGVASTLKHFPGHGDTTVDSHDALPTIDHDRATLEALDLPPFVAGIAAGAPAVMVGHLAVPALDPSGAPATLSPMIVEGLLRGELGFDGVVVTDGLNMGALEGFGTPGEIAVGAVNAGIDVLLLPPDLPAAYDAVLAAAQSGAIPRERLEQAVARILDLKQRLGVLAPAPLDPAAVALVGAPEHQSFRDELAALCGC